MVRRATAFGFRSLCAVLGGLALAIPALADPQVLEKGGTKYLENADRYLNEAPLIQQKPSPSPTSVPSPSPQENDKEETGGKIVPFSPQKNRPAPPAIIHSSRIFVGQEFPVPTGYSPARVQIGAGGYPIVTPSQPGSFETRRTGVLMETGGADRFEVTEFEGFINYGSPIRTAIPVYDEKGNPVGIQVLTTPNPVLQPVFKTFRREER
jgi:hypothetical protein